MSNDKQPGTGRLAGGKSPSYQRAVNEPETRASRFTARYMLASDIAYVLSAAELGATPRKVAAGLLKALLSLYDDVSAIDTSTPLGDVVAQREAWVTEKAGRENTAWLHLGRNRGESLRSFLPRMFFRQTLHEAAQANAKLLTNLVARARPVLESISPNYHHLQHSGLTTLGEYLLSWAVVFERHMERFEQVDRRLDKAPPPFGGRKILDDLYRDVSRRLGFSNRARLRRDAIWVHDQFTEPFFALDLALGGSCAARAGPPGLDDAGIWLLRACRRACRRQQRPAARESPVRASGGDRRIDHGLDAPRRRNGRRRAISPKVPRRSISRPASTVLLRTSSPSPATWATSSRRATSISRSCGARRRSTTPARAKRTTVSSMISKCRSGQGIACSVRSSAIII